MKHILVFAFSCVMLLVSACSTTSIDDIVIESDADPKINFSVYKTYKWLGSAEFIRDPEGQWNPQGLDAQAEITSLINRELAKRNLLENNAQSDLIVSYVLGINMNKYQIKTNPETRLSSLENIPKGALVIALVDAKTGYAVWASKASAEIKNLSADQAKTRLDYAVTQMMKQLPK